MRFIKGLLFVFGMMLVASPAAEARQAIGVHEKIVDGFAYLVDNSGSMMMEHMATGDQKIEMAKSIVVKLDSLVPDLQYNSALCLFSPNVTVVAPKTWAKMEIAQAALDISNQEKTFGRFTEMGTSFPAMSSAMNSLGSAAAVYMISDGNETFGATPAQAVAAMYQANPNLLVHVISLADTAEGKARLMEVAGLKAGSQYIDGRLLLDSEMAAENLVSSTLYVETIPSKAVYGTQEVLFAVGKYDIMPKYAKELDELAAVLSTRPELKIYVEGLADPSGSEDFNMTLAQNRANAVAQYLVNAGCDAEQFIAKGRGETDHFPTYQLDRRVDIMVIWQ